MTASNVVCPSSCGKAAARPAPLTDGDPASKFVQLNGMPCTDVVQLAKSVQVVPYINLPDGMLLFESTTLDEAMDVVVGMLLAVPCELGGSSAVQGLPSNPLAKVTGLQIFVAPHSPMTVPVHATPKFAPAVHEPAAPPQSVSDAHDSPRFGPELQIPAQ